MVRLACFVLTLPLVVQAQESSLFDAIRNNTLTAVTPETVNTRDRRETTLLMYAAAYGSLDTLTLLLNSGADVNAKNSFDSTALHWAAAEPERAARLIAKGADVNARTKQGRTPLMIAAACNGCSETVKLMLAKGADAQAADTTGVTALDLAAGAGDLESMRLLIARGAQAGTADRAGVTSLQYAAMHCSPEAIQLLLSKGADAQAANHMSGKVKFGDIMLYKRTALHIAAPFCSAAIVKTLVDRGAPVNTPDARGMTPLMLAVSSEHQDAAVVRTLLEAGADVKLASTVGETALDWAKKFGNREVLGLLTEAGAPAGVPFVAPRQPSGKPFAVKAAVERATSLLQKSAVEFFKQAGCVGCHHQPAAVAALVAARSHGAKVDEASAKDLVTMMSTENTGAQDRLFQRQDPGGGSDGAGYNLLALAAAKHPADAKTDTLVIHTGLSQMQAGNWHLGDASRAPVEESDIARTVRAMRTLQLYAPPARKPEFDAKIAHAATWLAAAKPSTNDDFAMQLVGLHWTGAAPAKIQSIGKSLLAAQREDGGWSQNPNLASDAFATGETLWALHESGILKPSDAAYQRGVKYLSLIHI